MYHLLDLDTFTRNDIDRVMKKTQAMERTQKSQHLEKITICNLFFEPSTRTIVSFDIAGQSLGAQVVNVATSQSSATKGESIIDTVKTLSAMGVNVFVIRHSQSGTPWLIQQHTKAHIINAGDGDHAHPTQALLDAYILQKHLSRSAWGGLKGKNIVIVGDIAHSRVAKSNIWGLSKLNARITLVAPNYFLTRAQHSEQWEHPFDLPNVRREPNLDNALKKADAVMVLRVQKERFSKKQTFSEKEYIKKYQLNAQRMAKAKPHIPILHPGPMNQGVEITADVAYSAQSCVEEQVSAGVAVRKALLTLVAKT